MAAKSGTTRALAPGPVVKIISHQSVNTDVVSQAATNTIFAQRRYLCGACPGKTGEHSAAASFVCKNGGCAPQSVSG
jgi:hypothetical protein